MSHLSNDGSPAKDKKGNKEPQHYKIDAGYYFKHLDPHEIENVITNF